MMQNRLFATCGGYVGVGPRCIENGDVVCILPGAQTPFVLRKRACVKGNQQTYTLFGECFVHGPMNGEGLGMGDLEGMILT